MKKLLAAVSVIGFICLSSATAPALTIDEIQTSTGPDWASPYADQWVDISGGVVTKVYDGYRTKIVIQDPTLGDAWAGILVSFDEPAMATGIVRGDQIDLTNVEIYEYMLLTITNVTVGAMDLGSHEDNYELFNEDGVCWAADYANYDLPPGSDYFVAAGEFYESVTGYLEQYQKESEGWDYYQLLGRDADDFVLGSSATHDASWGNIKSMFR